MTRKWLALALLAGLLLGGCATVGGEKVQSLPPQTKIAALSVMGDTLAIRHVGTTVFQNEKLDLKVPDWQIDQTIEAAALKQMAGGKFVAVSAQTDAARAAAGKMGTDFWTSGATLQGGPASITTLAAQAGADYVLVFGPAQYGDPFLGTNQPFSGYGIYQRGVFGRKHALNYLTMSAALFDGKSGAEVAHTRSYASSARAERLWMDSSALTPDPANAAATKVAIEELAIGLMRKMFLDLKLQP